MKQKLNNYLMIAAAALLGGCAQEENPQPGGTDGNGHALLVEEVRMESGTGGATRATTALTAGTIGVFRAKDTGASSAYPQECNNYQYTYSSGWKPRSAGNTVYLTGKDIEVCAYFYYRPNVVKTAVPLTSGRYTTGQDTGADDVDDFCYAKNRTVNASSGGRSTTFIMSHAMAWMEFVLYGEAGTTSLTVTNVTITHESLVSSTTLNITNGVYATGSVSGSLSYDPLLTISNATETTSALLIPFNLGGIGLQVTFTTDVNTSSVTIPAAFFGGKLEAGKRYRVKIALNGMEVTGVEVEDWTAMDINNGGNPFPI